MIPFFLLCGGNFGVEILLSKYIASELGVVLLLQGGGVVLGYESSPVKSCLATSPFGDGGFCDGEFGGAYLLLVGFPTLVMIFYFYLPVGLFNTS